MNPESSSEESAKRLLAGLKPLECRTYSVAEAAVVVGVRPSTIYDLIARGLLRAAKGLRHKRLPKEDVHRYADGK